VIQELKGKGQKAISDAKDATKDAVNKTAAAANKISDRRSIWNGRDRSLGPVFCFGG
jgi:hypothetical protein